MDSWLVALITAGGMLGAQGIAAWMGSRRQESRHAHELRLDLLERRREAYRHYLMHMDRLPRLVANVYKPGADVADCVYEMFEEGAVAQTELLLVASSEVRDYVRKRHPEIREAFGQDAVTTVGSTNEFWALHTALMESHKRTVRPYVTELMDLMAQELVPVAE